MSTAKYNDQAAHEIMVRSRVALLIDYPFFGTLAMRLELVEAPQIKTLDVDGKTLRYNPAYVKAQPTELNRSGMAHEVMHCVFDHCGAGGRGINLNPKKWNYAADYVVNNELHKAGFKIGPGWLYDPQFDGLTTEQVYALIPDPPEDDGGGGGGNGGPQDEVLPGSSDPAQQKADQADWQVATAQAANVAKAAGKLSESLERFLEKLKEPKVDWREQLRRFVTQIAKEDYSWARTNRKMQANGFILPGLYSESCGIIANYSDESGSVEDKIVQAFGAEINAIKEDLRPEKLIVGHFADRVDYVEEFAPDDEFTLVRRTNGGTDFRPIFRHVEAMAQPPVCIIILTDLYGPFPQTPPDIPVLWVCVNEQVAPFGETIHIEV